MPAKQQRKGRQQMNATGLVSETGLLSSAEELADTIKQVVRHATSARVHNLAVHMTGTHIVLEGFCATFHCYQLAQHAAMQSAEDLPVDNQIEVL
jgi:hypothetical protein